MNDDEKDCHKCPLRAGCDKVVWGEGGEAAIMIVGEYPGDEDDLMGRPFKGRDGALLMGLLGKAGFERKDYYLTHLVKCKPGDNQPDEAQIKMCGRWLWGEVRAVNPKIIVTLGKLPTRILMDKKKSFDFGEVVGYFHWAPYFNALIAPWYSTNHMLNHGKECDAETVAFLKTVKGRCS